MSNPRPRYPLARACALALVALLGVCAAVLVACGSSGTGLIPAASAGPLQSDFEAVAQAAQSGNGDCTATESALGKTQQDYLALPASVDAGLRKRLREGIENLRKVALAMCAQPAATATTATTTTPTTTTQTTTTSTQTTPTTTTSTQTTPVSPPETGEGNSGGTPAEGGESEEGPGKGKGVGKGKGEGDGEGSSGGASPEGR